jgi:hypothetical protein
MSGTSRICYTRPGKVSHLGGPIHPQLAPEADIRRLILLALAAVLLAGCATPEPQIVESTVEVTRIVEVTRVVQITTTPPPPTIIVVTPTVLPGPLQVEVKLSLFWASRDSGQVNIKTTSKSSTTISGITYHCTVVSKKTGETLTEQDVKAEPIPPGETNISWFKFSVKSEHTPGYFQVDCQSQGIDPLSGQFFSPGSQTTLPGRPSSNGTSACTLALESYDRAVDAFFLVKTRYEKQQATYDELVGAYFTAIGAYYAAVTACQ